MAVEVSGVAAGRYRLDSSVVGGLAGPEEDHLLEYEEEAFLFPAPLFAAETF